MAAFHSSSTPEPQQSPIHANLARLGVVEQIQENLRASAATVTLRCAAWRVPFTLKASWDPSSNLLRYQNKLGRPITLDPLEAGELTSRIFVRLQGLNDVVARAAVKPRGLQLGARRKNRELGGVLEAPRGHVPWGEITAGVWNGNRDRVFAALFDTEAEFLDFGGELRRSAAHSGISVSSDPSVGLLLRDGMPIEKGNAYYPGDVAVAQLLSFTGKLTGQSDPTTIWWDGERFFYHRYTASSASRSRELHLA